MKSDADPVLARINKARVLLAEAKSLPEIKHVIAMGQAAQVYAKQVGASTQTINEAGEIHLLAKHRLGWALKANPPDKTKKLKRGTVVPKSNHGESSSLAESGITKKESSEAQLLASVPEGELLEIAHAGEIVNVNRVVRTVRDKKKSGERKRKRTEAADAAPQLDSRIIVGDFRDGAKNIADGSVSLIFTDPPYDREASKMLPALGEFASAKLADGGSLICYVGHTQLPAALDALRHHLRYWWTIACVHSGGSSVMQKYGIRAEWKPVLWFVKGTRDDVSVMVRDVMSGGKEKSHHDWQQAQSEAEYWIENLCPKDGIVCDPFLGGGTTAAAAQKLGRSWVGFEIDSENARIASARVAG